MLDRSSGVILVLLLQGSGDPVAKEALMRAGWPSRVVNENSLAKAVGRLRQALGPDGAHLEAIYGQGYRLVVDATCTSGVSLPPAAPEGRLVGGAAPFFCISPLPTRPLRWLALL